MIPTDRVLAQAFVGDNCLCWTEARLKLALRRMVAGGTPSSSNPVYWTEDYEAGTPWVAISDITESAEITSTAKSVSQEGIRAAGLSVLPEGTLLYSIYASLGKVALLRCAAVTNQAILGLVPNERVVHQPFLRWWLIHAEANVLLLSSSNTQANLNAEKVGNIPLLLPALPTQKTIADYLDEKTAAIDALIEKKRKLLDLLAEGRAAFINQAVTKGLDPTMPMKDSGIPWTGEVPTHWSVVAVSWFSRVFNGATPSRSRPDYWDGTVPWISSGRVNDWLVIEPTAFISDDAVLETGLTLAPKGSVVIGMVGQGRTRGMAARLGIDAYINQNMAAIVPADNLDATYLHYALVQGYKPIREYGRGGQQDALNCDLVGAIRVPFPPIEEQRGIARDLTHQAKVERKRRSALHQQLDRLQEYRQALITAAVTGQLDIGAAA